MWSISLIYIFLFQVVIKYQFCYGLFINLNFDGHGPITLIQHLVWTSSHASIVRLMIRKMYHQKHKYTIKHTNITLPILFDYKLPKIFRSFIHYKNQNNSSITHGIRWFLFDVIVIFKSCSLSYYITRMV